MSEHKFYPFTDRRITYYAKNYEEEFVKLVLDSALREMEKIGPQPAKGARRARRP